MNKNYINKIKTFANQVETSPYVWDCEKLCQWIEEILMLPEYTSSLRKKNISGKKMIMLMDTTEELKSLGFQKIGHRKLLIQQLTVLIKKFSQPLPKKNRQKKHLSFEDIKLKFFSTSNPIRTKSVPFNQIPLDNSNLISEEEMDLSIIKEMEGCGDQVFEWKSKEVSTWLKGLGLSSLVERFEQNKIRGDILLDVTENTLKDLGITSMGVTKKILNSIERIHPQYFKKKEKKEDEEKDEIQKEKEEISSNSKLKNSNSPRLQITTSKISPKKWNINLVCKWLETIGMSQYEPNFRKDEIDGAILLQISQEDLADIGISAFGHRKKIITEISKLKDKSL